MMEAYTPTYHNLTITTPDDLGPINVNYIESGDPSHSTLLLLHGFPSSSRQFRDLIPMLSSRYHILAPDLPGFGLTTVPQTFPFTFSNLTSVISTFLQTLHISSYAIYIFDYGAPVGLRLALQNPQAIKAIITQNGNAYEQGFGHPFWDDIMLLWSENNSPSQRSIVTQNVLTLSTTKAQYTIGVPSEDIKLIDPGTWTTDYLTNIAGQQNQQNQLDLFYDYRTNVTLYPSFQQYFRDSKVPLLAVWGRGDPAFVPAGAEAFKKDLPEAEVKFLDGGHFLLETRRWDVAGLVKEFLKCVGKF